MEQGYSKQENRILGFISLIQSILYFTVTVYYWGTPNFVILFLLFFIGAAINIWLLKFDQFQSLEWKKLSLSLLNLLVTFLMISFSGQMESPFFPMYYLPLISIVGIMLFDQKAYPLLIILTLSSVLTLTNIALGPDPTYRDWLKSGVFILSYFALGYSVLFHHRRLKSNIDLLEVDYLTGVYSRQMGDQLLQENSQYAMENKMPLSICFSDLDRFKRLNDQFGHLCGDYILKEVASLLTQSLGEKTPIIRWGGEEFLILFLNKTKVEALMEMEKARRLIESQPFTYEGFQHKVTISGGIVDIAEKNYHVTCSIHEADSLLYRAKDKGRNQVILDEKIKYVT